MKHEGDNLRREDCEVRIVPVSQIMALIKEYHYTHSASTAAVAAIALFYKGRLSGGALWMAQRKSAAQSMWRGSHKRVLCLSRLVIHPDVPRNGASFLLGACAHILRRKHYRCLTTYADTLEGHTGAIYLAAGWEPMGRTPPRPRWQNVQGKVTSRKQGRRWRTIGEMQRMGYAHVGNSVKLKFRKVL